MGKVSESERRRHVGATRPTALGDEGGSWAGVGLRVRVRVGVGVGEEPSAGESLRIEWARVWGGSFLQLSLNKPNFGV